MPGLLYRTWRAAITIRQGFIYIYILIDNIYCFFIVMLLLLLCSPDRSQRAGCPLRILIGARASSKNNNNNKKQLFPTPPVLMMTILCAMAVFFYTTHTPWRENDDDCAHAQQPSVMMCEPSATHTGALLDRFNSGHHQRPSSRLFQSISNIL